MSYVDAFYEQSKDVVTVVERVDGERVVKELKPVHNFYYKDPNGKTKSIYGDPVTEVRCTNIKDFKKNVGINKHNGLYESDIRPLNKTLAVNYTNCQAPKLQTAFIDIEADFDPGRGYSSPQDPYSIITAIGIYLDWMETMICLAVPPKRISFEQANEMTKDMPEVILYKTEKEMLDAFLTLIDDADIISGWNSEGYDIPYIVNRITKTMGKAETRRLCLMKKLPKARSYEKYGNEVNTYDIIGRIHLDYLELYRKYNYE